MPTAEPAPSRWRAEDVALIGAGGGARLPLLDDGAFRPALPHLDVWDMWQVADADGLTLQRDGRDWWFFLAVPRGADPEARHDHARIHLLSHGGDGWRDHGPALPDGLAPGSREWSGSALLAPDGETLTLFLTAAGDRHGGPHFRQRLFATTGRLLVADGGGRCTGWSDPVEAVRADPRWYAPADQPAPVDGGIEGFRDPGYFRDPADGAEYLLFTATAAGADAFAGVIGLARRAGAGWTGQPPLIDATGVNAELERPHVVVVDGRYYLFWSTQARRFAPGLIAPTGLYAMVAERMAGPWQPVNGSGLVAGNPVAAPWQGYCWWVTGEGRVLSFLDYRGPTDPHAASVAERRARFGGTPAPAFGLRFEEDVVAVA